MSLPSAADLLAGDRADILLDCLQDLGYVSHSCFVFFSSGCRIYVLVYLPSPPLPPPISEEQVRLILFNQCGTISLFQTASSQRPQRRRRQKTRVQCLTVCSTFLCTCIPCAGTLVLKEQTMKWKHSRLLSMQVSPPACSFILRPTVFLSGPAGLHTVASLVSVLFHSLSSHSHRPLASLVTGLDAFWFSSTSPPFPPLPRVCVSVFIVSNTYTVIVL